MRQPMAAGPARLARAGPTRGRAVSPVTRKHGLLVCKNSPWDAADHPHDPERDLVAIASHLDGDSARAH
jgi:hypothetical protein